MDSDIKKRKCCLPACFGDKLKLVHKFPMAEDISINWKQVLSPVVPDIKDLNMEDIRKKYYVCYRHFMNKDYKNMASRNLNKTAIPSVNFLSLTDNHACLRFVTVKALSINDTTLSTNERHFATESLQALQEPIRNQSVSLACQQLAKRKIDLVESVRPKVVRSTCTKNSAEVSISNAQSQISTHQNNELLFKQFASPNQTNILFKKNLQPSLAPLANSSKNLTKMPLEREVTFNTTLCTSVEKKNMPPLLAPISQRRVDYPIVSGKPNDVFVNFARTAIKLPSETAAEPEVFKKKLVALFEVTENQLLELKEQLSASTAQILSDQNTLINNDIDTMAIELASEKYPTPIKINYLWLRDHCRCSKCYNDSTFQRKINLLDIPINIVPDKYDYNDETLNVVWNDGHESVYKMDFLYENQYDVHKKIVAERDIFLWNKDQIEGAGYARVNLSDLICNEEPIKVIVKSLLKYGIAFIENVPANTQSTEMAIKRLFPIKKTLFGEMWTFSDDKDHSDTAYTKDFLPVHTDNTYFNDGAGLQVLHCIQHTGTGGLSLLQDGFKALKDFKDKHPDSYQRLTEISIPSEYIEEGQHHKYNAPIIRLNPLTNEPEQLRYNTLDRAPLNTIPLEKISQFYNDYRKLSNEIQNPEHEWWFKLNPGTIVIFDNWRVLHGRSEYVGKRVMTGCYVERTDFMSLARVLKAID